MVITRLVARIAVAAAVAALLTVGCIGTAAAQEKQKDPIVIGASVPLTGVFAFAGVEFQRGFQDWVEWLNNHGGIKGHPVRYHAADTGYDLDQSMAVFHRITNSYDVDFYFGDSTAFEKAVSPQLKEMDIMLTGASFASALDNPEEHPCVFLPGPSYSEQVGILLKYIANESPDARVAFVHSNTEFGRDPIPAAKEMAKELGLEVVAVIQTPPGSTNISAQVLKLRQAHPDYAIMHGYVLAPIPSFIELARKMGMDTQFMGTYYTMDQRIIDQMGKAAKGFMGVMPYRYYYAEDWKESKLLQVIHKLHDEYQSTYYIQAWVTGTLIKHIAAQTLEAGKSLTCGNMRETIAQMEHIETGGLIGKTFAFDGNSIPVARIYRANVSKGRMEPVSGWITLD